MEHQPWTKTLENLKAIKVFVHTSGLHVGVLLLPQEKIFCHAQVDSKFVWQASLTDCR